ncbi:MAG: hypothetical protein MJ173_09740, partial [Clostridia bacterium]|nr:hypothetical protein [Clostridia bacterium]
FECCTFDLSDNSPFVFFNPIFHRQKSFKKLLGRKAGEKAKNYSIFNFETLVKSGISGGRNDHIRQKFRVLHLRTLEQLSISNSALLF